jgi:hypothetical protein
VDRRGRRHRLQLLSRATWPTGPTPTAPKRVERLAEGYEIVEIQRFEEGRYRASWSA